MESVDECSICLEELISNIITLSCNHSYHNKCILRDNIKNCPLCRHPININNFKNLNILDDVDSLTPILINEMSKNYLIDINYFLDNNHIQWDWIAITNNILLNKYNKDAINWNQLTLAVSYIAILNNPELPWNWTLVTHPQLIQLKQQKILIMLQNNISYEGTIDPNWNFDWYSLSYVLPIEFIMTNTYLNFNWRAISNRLPEEFRLANVYLEPTWDPNPFVNIDDSEFNWNSISNQLNINFIIDNKELDFNWYDLTPRLPINFIIENKHLNFNWYILANELSIEFIINNHELNFNWYDISNKLPINFILKHKNKHYNWNVIRPKLSWFDRLLLWISC